MTISLRIVLLPIVLWGLVIGSNQAAAQSAPIVREVVVEGTQRIEPDTVRSYLLVKEGDPFDAARVNKSLKSLFATGLFADVTFRVQGSSLIVNVVENPVINRIAFEGNHRIDDEEMSAEVTLRPRVIYTRTKVQSDVQRILTLYRRSGRFAATVDPKVIQLPQNRVDLVFEISEGPKTEVESIRFIGNREFSDSRLREVIRTRQTRWYNFFSSDDTYDPDRLTLDRELLRRFYLNEGFADFNVVSTTAELTPDRKDFFITFQIEEGIRYEVGDVSFDITIKDLAESQLADTVDLETGDWYDSEQVDDIADDLIDRVGTLGFPFVDVRPKLTRDRERKAIDIVYEVKEGPRIFVERIDIKGNSRTTDNVVRREFRLVEGDAFNASKLRRSRQRINNLNFFEKVEIERLPGSTPDKTVIAVDVKEKSTGSFSVGAGFSTMNGPLLDFSIQERNLLGKGQSLSLSTTLADKLSAIDLSFTEPYFLDREIAAGVDVFHKDQDLQDESSYNIASTGFALRTGYPLSEDLNQRWKYTLNFSNIKNVPSSASSVIEEDKGKKVLSELSHTLIYDKRDSRISPTEGYYTSLTTDLAGLGGDARYMRNTLEGGQYFRLEDQWVLSFTGQAGYIVALGEDLDVRDRFYLGGDQLRGFATAGVGPRDNITDDALGGEWTYSGSAQLEFPIGLPNEYGIKAHIFSDMGSSGGIKTTSTAVDDTGALRASVGAGISWVSPFGPIGIDFGVPVLQEDYDITESFRMSFGTRF